MHLRNNPPPRPAPGATCRPSQCTWPPAGTRSACSSSRSGRFFSCLLGDTCVPTRQERGAFSSSDIVWYVPTLSSIRFYTHFSPIWWFFFRMFAWLSRQCCSFTRSETWNYGLISAKRLRSTAASRLPTAQREISSMNSSLSFFAFFLFSPLFFSSPFRQNCVNISAIMIHLIMY